MILKPRLFRKPNLGHPLARDLVGYWLFNEGDGNEVLDLSRNENTGTLVNGTFWSSGEFGAALELDGANDYVNCGSNSSLDQLPSFSIFMRIYSKGAGDFSAFTRLMDKRPAGTGWTFIHHTTDNNLDLIIDRTVDFRVQSSDNAVTQNTWQDVGVSFDGSLIATNCHMYVNGIETGYKTQTDGSGARLDDSAGDLIIGNSAIDSFQRSIKGLIGLVMIYNRVLSASEYALFSRKPFILFERDPIELWVGATSVGAPPVGAAGIMTTNTGYWGPTF